MTEFLATFADVEKAARGIASIFETERGLGFSRLPDWTYVQHRHAPTVAKMAHRASASRLAFETQATSITVTYRATRESHPPSNWESGPSVISATAGGFEESIPHTNGDLKIWKDDLNFDLVSGEDSVAVFTLPNSNGPRIVEIWLPHNCEIELVGISANSPIKPAAEHRPKWVHYGSSISHCEDAASPLTVWPAAVSRQLELDLFNLGLSGSANLEQFAARTIRDLNADLISLKLGINVVNNASYTARTFVPAVHGFIDTIREGNRDAKILVISPVACPAHEINPGPSETDEFGRVKGQEPSRHSWIGELTLVSIREMLRQIVEDRAREDTNIFYMDGLKLLNEREAESMPDGIHPDNVGYELMAKNFLARVPKTWL